MNKRSIDQHDYEIITQLSLIAKRRVAGLVTGEQRSPIQGGGIEFADYREYQPGDDVRRVDWSVFLRLRRLMVKLCAEEKELTVMLLIDASRSMRFGDPDKLWLAGRIAALLAGIAIHDGNRAGLLTLGSDLREIIRPERTQGSLHNFVTAAARIEPVTAANPVDCMRQFASRYTHRCMAVFLTDLLFPDWAKVIAGLAASGCEAHVVQLLATEELSPPYLGEATLADLEDRGEVSLHIGHGTTQLYRKELALFLNEVRQACHRNGIGHTMLRTDTPLAAIFHHDLRRGGLVC